MNRQTKARNSAWRLMALPLTAYQFSLRRWPKEADVAITDGVPEFKATDGSLPAGRALPIAKARIKIGAFDRTVAVTARDKAVAFTVPLKATPKTQLQTWFYDAQGNQFCGAYFVYANRQ